MPKDFWNLPPAKPPTSIEIDGQIHFIRNVTPYDLGLVSSQCTAYCGVDIQSFQNATPVQQIKAVSFFAAFALCDENGKPYFDSGPDEDGASDDFLKQVEIMAHHDLNLLIRISTDFIELNSDHMDPELLDDAKKNLMETNLESGR